jgi:hypothetical protein
MIDLLTGGETFDAHRIRAWAGVATDEGVGLICLVEVSDASGRLVCRFEVLLPEALRHLQPWTGSDTDAARRLLDHTLERARAAVAAASLSNLHGRHLEIT